MQIQKLSLYRFLERPPRNIPDGQNALVYFKTDKEGFRNISRIKFKEPLFMTKALINIRQIFDNIFSSSPEKMNELDVVWRFIKNNRQFKDKKSSGIFMPGRTSIAVEMTNGEVLKLSRRNPFHAREHSSDFDLPLLSAIEKYTENGVDYYAYIQARADMSATKETHVKEVIKKIRQNGFCPDDIWPKRTDQVGIYKGKPYLVDSECAK